MGGGGGVCFDCWQNIEPSLLVDGEEEEPEEVPHGQLHHGTGPEDVATLQDRGDLDVVQVADLPSRGVNIKPIVYLSVHSMYIVNCIFIYL